MQALEELDYLAALDNEGNLSEMGIIMSEFPLEPQMSKTLLASCEYDCVSEVVIIAAMLTGNSVLPTFAHAFGWMYFGPIWDFIVCFSLFFQLRPVSWFLPPT